MALPIANGTYTFLVKHTEHPDIPGGTLQAEIVDDRITLVSKPGASVFLAGVVEEGRLQWHASSGRWIIGDSEADASAPDAGGCSDGPSVIDLKQRIYWTC